MTIFLANRDIYTSVICGMVPQVGRDSCGDISGNFTCKVYGRTFKNTHTMFSFPQNHLNLVYYNYLRQRQVT